MEDFTVSNVPPLVNPLTEAIKQVRHMVSRDKNRFMDLEHDLDLTYITDRLIAMGFPSQDFVQSTYRNSIDEFGKFLKLTHPGKFLVINLTEKPYNAEKFEHRIAHYPMFDHHSPSLAMLLEIMKHMKAWLDENAENVVAVHCKAGRGRTGTIIASYLLWSGVYGDSESALEFFASKRSTIGEGVQVPSQARYVYYIQQIMTQSIQHVPLKALVLERILIRPIPSFTLDDGCTLSMDIKDVWSGTVVYSTPEESFRIFKRSEPCAILIPNVPLEGDILMRFFHQPSPSSKVFIRTVPMFRMAFHTNFVVDHHLDFSLPQLDSSGAGYLKDKRFSPEFSVRLMFMSM